ncbi:MAG: AraC family transcriptional regulator [Reichenbachiella sp.]|uniref:AraC family transcriptional regulator n=1 Tax=Reichenbachiella sp. TaxID=2184521 RepID=UPI0032633038
MKPKELSRISPSHTSFSLELHQLPFFLNVWHYHNEIELLHIRKSTGMKFVGDYIGSFAPGDLLLFGSNLPHMMLNEKLYFEKNKIAEALVVHFDPNLLGESFFSAPELVDINHLLRRSQVGLSINDNKKEIIKRMDQIRHEEGFARLISLLEILNLIASTNNVQPLSSPHFVDSFDTQPYSKLNKAYEYIFKNFNGDISLNLVADHVNMNASAFSRFFKKATNKSFVYYLIELKIGYACKRLIEADGSNIAQICYECGFNNLSNFNKQFKVITGRTPKEYVNAHKV